MANGKDECRELCKKYTTLRDEEIEEIYPFLDDLQDIADREQSNVYIDCMTYTGKSMVIVGEAFPKEKGTIYTEPLFGKIMYTKNEPAVARTFGTGVPTKNVTGEEVISSRIMVQQVYPIKHGDKTVAVLIYEKLYDKPLRDAQEELAKRSGRAKSLKNFSKIVDKLNEGIILVDNDDNICYYNDFVEGIFDELGYVGQIFGMEIHNILGNDSEGRYRLQMRGYTLDGRIIDIGEDDVKYAVVLDDVTGIEKLRDARSDLELKLHEERHSVKNGLMFLEEFAKTKGKHSSGGAGEEDPAYREMHERVGMMRAIMELKLQNEGGFGVKQALKYVFLNKIDLLSGEKDLSIEIAGDDVLVSDEACNTIISIVYELICNSVKHAFKGRDRGRIKIEIKKGYVTSSITYTDDGVGFSPEDVGEGSHGLEIIITMVEDKLNGMLKIESGKNGTKVFFDFIE